METLQDLLVNGNVQAVMAVVIIGLVYAIIKVWKVGRADIKELVGKLETKNEKYEKLQELRGTDSLKINLAYQKDVGDMVRTMEKLATVVDTLARNGR